MKPSNQDEIRLVRMTTIDDAYQFFVKVEEKINRIFERKQRGRDSDGNTGRRSYGGQNEDQKKYEKSISSLNHKGDNDYLPSIKIMVTEEEEVCLYEGLEEKAFTEHIFNVKKKDIKHMSVCKIKEG